MTDKLTAKEKRLRKQFAKASVELIRATFETKDGFERTISLMQDEIAVAVGSLAALGMSKADGEQALADLAAYGLEKYRAQFALTESATADMARQSMRPQ